MGEDHGHNTRKIRRRVTIISGLAVVGIVIPWLLQDPNYRDLDRLPMKITSIKGIELEPTAKLIAREGPPGPDGDRYFIQYTFKVHNPQQRAARGIRLHLRGIDSEGRVLFTARSKPRMLDLGPGAAGRAFLRARDISEATVQKLRQLTVEVRITPPAKPR